MNRFTLLLIVPLTVLVYGCANVSQPTGGKKDETPPELIKTLPEQKSRNFNGKTLELVFDEFIQVENLKQELIITPDVQGNYEYKPIKNGIRLQFEQPFQPNTTYTLNFRNAIKDVTEKNVATSAKLIFSTGSNLDTLSIQGDVVDLLTGKPVDNAVVSLYRSNDTLDVLKHKPYYFTRTDKKGAFLLENLKQDTYKLYAIDDRNNNQKFDQLVKNEKIAFLDNPIVLDSSHHNINLFVSQIDATPPRITSRNSEISFFELEFDEGLTKATITAPQLNNQLVYQLREEGQTVRVFNTVNRTDSIPAQITAVDSMGNTLAQAFNIKFDEPKKNNRAPEQPKDKFEVKVQPGEGEKVLRDFQYSISFSKPVTRYTLNKIQLLADTTTSIPLTNEDFSWDPYFTQLQIRKRIDVKKSVRLVAPKETFFSVDGDTAMAIKTTHELKNAENFGSMAGKVTTNEPYFIVQLLGSDQKVVAEIRNQANFKFNYLNAGDYSIRIIIDRNNNGQWDQGNLLEKRQPEPIIFGPQGQKLRENWDLTDQNVVF